VKRPPAEAMAGRSRWPLGWPMRWGACVLRHSLQGFLGILIFRLQRSAPSAGTQFFPPRPAAVECTGLPLWLPSSPTLTCSSRLHSFCHGQLRGRCFSSFATLLHVLWESALGCLDCLRFFSFAIRALALYDDSDLRDSVAFDASTTPWSCATVFGTTVLPLPMRKVLSRCLH